MSCAPDSNFDAEQLLRESSDDEREPTDAENAEALAWLQRYAAGQVSP